MTTLKYTGVSHKIKGLLELSTFYPTWLELFWNGLEGKNTDRRKKQWGKNRIGKKKETVYKKAFIYLNIY